MFRKAQTPSVSEHAKLRSRQISEFLKLNPTAQPALNGAGAGDQTATYTLQIQTHTSGLLTLTVILGALFPERPPICQLTVTNSLSHRLHHNYLDGNGYLSLHPKLNQSHWSPHQNLGLLIQDIIREFIQSPPQLVGPNTPAFSAQPPPPQQQQAPQYPPYQHNQMPSLQQSHQQLQPVPPPPSSYMQQQQQQPSASHPSQTPSLASSSSVPFQSTPPPNYMVPPIPPRRPSNGGISSAAASSSSSVSLTRSRPPEVPTSFPQLDGLSIAQLESYLVGDDSADSIRDLAGEQPQLSKLDGVIQQLCDSLEKLAESNLSKRTELENLTSQVNLEATKCREQQQLYHQLLQRQHAAMQKYSLSSTIQQLDSAIESIDQQSESTQSRIEFDKSAPELDQSRIESYIKERILYHERAAKRERLQEIYGKQ